MIELKFKDRWCFECPFIENRDKQLIYSWIFYIFFNTVQVRFKKDVVARFSTALSGPSWSKMQLQYLENQN